jgi:lipoprotein-releasing system ATP-binding protein
MLQLNKINKSYSQRGIVLDNLDLVINEGDTISIAGPSGSGKTTLLNIIGLLDKPDSGEVIFKGVSTLGFNNNEAADYRSRNIGFVFQDHLLLPHLTVWENIILPLSTGKITNSEYSSKLDHAKALMENIGIISLYDKYPEYISGGEAQRTALVRALINKPSLLLADEPTGSLDRRNSETLSDLLIEMNRLFGISVLVATHSQGLADRMARKFSLENGKLSSNLK